jgi:predicted DNA-binding transcriptional regulator AlpA
MPKTNAAIAIDELRVITLEETAKILGVSFATLLRMKARNEGPPTIKLSQRRIGVRIVDLREWQEKRRG